MKLNLFKKTIKVDKERISQFLDRANELLESNPKLGLTFLNIANELYNNYNPMGQFYKLIPEVKETLFRYESKYLFKTN